MCQLKRASNCKRKLDKSVVFSDWRPFKAGWVNDYTLSVIMSFKRREKEDEHSPHLNSTALRAPVSQCPNRTECVVPAEMRRINSCGQIPGLSQDDNFSLAQRGSTWLTRLSHSHSRVRKRTAKAWATRADDGTEWKELIYATAFLEITKSNSGHVLVCCSHNLFVEQARSSFFPACLGNTGSLA